MPEKRMQEQLRRTVRYVVETMCFSDVAPADERFEGADTIVTTVNFYGSRSGRLKLEVSSGAAWSLTDAFLGRPSSSPESSTSESSTSESSTSGSAAEEAPSEHLVGELGSMICGRFLSAVDPLGELSLAEPQVSKARPAETSGTVWENFELDGGRLSASVQFDRE